MICEAKAVVKGKPSMRGDGQTKYEGFLQMTFSDGPVAPLAGRWTRNCLASPGTTVGRGHEPAGAQDLHFEPCGSKCRAVKHKRTSHPHLPW